MRLPLAALMILAAAAPAHAVIEQPIAGGPTVIGFDPEFVEVDASPIFDTAPVDGTFGQVRADLTVRARYSFTADETETRNFSSTILVEFTDAFDGAVAILEGSEPLTRTRSRAVNLVAGESYDVVFEFDITRLVRFEYGTSNPADKLFDIIVYANFTDFQDDLVDPVYIVSYAGFVTDDVPAPAAFALFGLGALGLAALRRR